MATVPLPPPQAYTRDMLAAAYEWMRSQPQSVRELATNSDSLVALYLQARRRNGGTMPTMTETSSEAFKQDLRALAEGMKQFESPTAPAPMARAPMPIAPPLQQPLVPSSAQENFNSLDIRTIEVLRKVQALCNLGSEREALRLLVAVGYERVCEMFPQTNSRQQFIEKMGERLK